MSDLIAAGNAMADFLSGFMDDEVFDEVHGLLLDWEKAVFSAELEENCVVHGEWCKKESRGNTA